MPDRELADAALVLVGGVLLLTPGFITDVAGFLFVLPFTRPLVRRGLRGYLGRRVRGAREQMVRRMSASVGEGVFPPGVFSDDPRGGSVGGQDGSTIRGEVIREDRPEA
jgi:UPF0716 protein FxsA